MPKGIRGSGKKVAKKPTLTIKDLVDNIGTVKDLGVSKKDIGLIVTRAVEDVVGALKKNRRVILHGLGILKMHEKKARPARVGRNPKTGEAVNIPAKLPVKVIKFRVARGLKADLNPHLVPPTPPASAPTTAVVEPAKAETST